MENFIGIYENAYSPEYCNEVINWFESANEVGFGKNRFERDKVHRHNIDDVSIFWDIETLKFSCTPQLSKHFIDLFWTKYYAEYTSKFSVLNNYPRHTLYEIKLQKISPGGGYHGWHAENAGKDCVKRISTFILYLNDVHEGGETEFLYYGLRVKPKQGTLILWPAGYTHTHRGNPPLKETKYIVTGWLEFE